MRRLAAVMAALLLVGCAAKLGPVVFVFGDAQVCEGQGEAQTCVTGGKLSTEAEKLLELTVGRAIDAAAGFFGIGRSREGEK